MQHGNLPQTRLASNAGAGSPRHLHRKDRGQGDACTSHPHPQLQAGSALDSREMLQLDRWHCQQHLFLFGECPVLVLRTT